jgi:predicted transcriptional regulator of viral defense system
MKLRLLSPFEGIPYFTVEGFKQLAEADETRDYVSVRTLLYRWAKTGHILRLKKGVYMTRRFYEQHGGDASFSAAVSAILLPQSYVSLEFILQRHSVLTEITYPVTAVTLKNTHTIENKVGTFSYRHIRPDLYKGFSIGEYYGVRMAQASLAKALFDYFYLRPVARTYRGSRFNLAEELRLDLESCSRAAQAEFAGYVEESQSAKMSDILENLRRTVWRP